MCREEVWLPIAVRRLDWSLERFRSKKKKKRDLFCRSLHRTEPNRLKFYQGTTGVLGSPGYLRPRLRRRRFVVDEMVLDSGKCSRLPYFRRDTPFTIPSFLSVCAVFIVRVLPLQRLCRVFKALL